MAEAVTDVRQVSLAPREFHTRFGALFLFLPMLARLDLDALARAARLPSSRMIPPAHALRACLALKLWSIERKSHVMSLVADPGLACSPLNACPKKSYLCEATSRVSHAQTTALLAAFQQQTTAEQLLPGQSFNLDFHSVPYHGEHPAVERHYVAMRSRRQSSILTFLAQTPKVRPSATPTPICARARRPTRSCASSPSGRSTTVRARATSCSTRS